MDDKYSKKDIDHGMYSIFGLACTISLICLYFMTKSATITIISSQLLFALILILTLISLLGIIFTILLATNRKLGVLLFIIKNKNIK
jgi:hypothetical protein